MVKWWQRISFKLFLAIFGLLVVIIGAIFGSVYWFLPDYQYQQELNRNYKQLESFIDRMETLSIEEIRENLIVFYGHTNIKVIIAAHDGQLIFPFIRSYAIDEPDILIGPLEARDDNYTSVREIEVGGVYYIISYSIPITSKERIRQTLLIFLFYGFLISSILAGGGAWFLAKRITGPVLAINETANKMEQLDFSAVLPTTRVDELGQLSEHLNSMSKSVELNLIELNSANAQLQIDAEILKFEEQKRQELAAVISHELKTPIAAVMGQLEAMSLNIGPYADRDHYLLESYRIMVDMEKLAEDILEITKVNYVDLQDNLQSLNVSELVEEIVDRQRQFFSSTLVTNVNVPKGIWIDTQVILFSKALENIISNAYQYCLPNGQVNIIVKERAAEVEIDIANTAASLSEENLARIFEPFYRVDQSRNRQNGGTGLGLYIVANNFEKLHIRYEMTSHKENVHFKIYIPLKKGAPSTEKL